MLYLRTEIGSRDALDAVSFLFGVLLGFGVGWIGLDGRDSSRDFIRYRYARHG